MQNSQLCSYSRRQRWQTDEILPASCHGGGTLPANDRLGARRRAERRHPINLHRCRPLRSPGQPSGGARRNHSAGAFRHRPCDLAGTRLFGAFSRLGTVFLLNGNIPLIDADTIRSAFDAHKRAGNAATILAAFVKNSNGYPHIARSADGAFAGILAEQDANETGREVSAGAGRFRCDQLLRATGQIAEECTGRESNLIDVVQCMLDSRQHVGVFTAADRGVLRSKLMIASNCST